MPEIEKKKGGKRRSVRTYVNANKPLAVPLSEIAEYFPPDPDDDDQPAPQNRAAGGGGRVKRPRDVNDVEQPDIGKRDYSQGQRRRLAREGKAMPDLSFPVDDAEDLQNAVHLYRTGHQGKDPAATRRYLERRSRELGVSSGLGSSEKGTAGNPVQQPAGGRNVTDRTSQPLTEGHQAPSSGDHGIGAGRPAHIAVGHLDLRQSTVAVTPLATLRSFNGDNEFGDRDITRPPGQVQVSRLDAAAASGLGSPPGNPAARMADHIARLNVTGPDGGHGLADAQSRPPVAAKNSDRVEIMKRHMFPGSGGAR